MKKKALIITTTLLLVIAVAVGVTFAAWNVNKQSKNFDVSIGKNIDLAVTFNNYNGAQEDGVDNMILIPNGAVLETNPNNAYNVLFGDFTITANGGWDSDTLKAIYTVKELKFDGKNLADAENSAYNVFDIKVYTVDNVDINETVSKSVPKADATAIDGDTALTLNATYYVFVSFKNDFNGKPADFIGKALQIKLEISAAVITA